MMGAHVLEQARLHEVGKLVIAGTVCAYPKLTPVPFSEDELWNGYPEETNAPYGVAKKAVLVGAQAYREQYGLNSIFLLPANLYGPRDNFDLETLARDPGADPEDGRRRGTRSCSGATARRRASSSTSRTAVEALVLAAERYDGAEPVNLGTGAEISIRDLAELVAEITGFDGRRSPGTRRCRTASRAARSTPAWPGSSSAWRRRRPCATGSSARSPGIAPPRLRMPSPDRARSLLRPSYLLVSAIVLGWLTALVVGVRADADVGARELASALLLSPLALVCAFTVAESVGGVALGAWTLFVWVALPWLAPAFTLGKYDETMRDDVFPLFVGLTADAGYAEGVVILAATALLTVRMRATRIAGALLLAAMLVVWLLRAGSVGDLSVDTLQANMAGLREYFWSQRVLQWLPIAGAIGYARRSVPLALGLGGWLGGYVAFRASRTGVGFEDGEFFRVLLPALPAYILLAAAIPLLVPTLAARLGPLAEPQRRP